ncbi:tetratricopeptide repeat protein [Prosthecobacter sp.]|uniref:tetratricopeptide repeat protein n=1 Tax=Prosthecobacter sp. TaxID=1965333 RepID=UPI003784C31C
MHRRIVFCLLFLTARASAQTPTAGVPAPAQRYLDILVKRPQPGTIFERFYSAWLEESSPAELGVFLEARAKLPAATAADQLLLAVFHAHRGDDRAALTAYEAALQLDPANAAAWIERARLESRAFDFTAALQSLDAAAKAKPDEAGTMEIGKLRGRALLRLSRNAEALSTWKELAAAHANDEDLTEELIDLLTDEGQYEAALETAQGLIKRSRDPVARTLRQLRLADILLLAERRDEALKTLRETLTATGADSWIEGDVLGRVNRVFRMGDDVAGLEKFMASLVQENPQRVALAWQHTKLLGENGLKDAALKQARALLQANPGRRDLQEGFLDLLESLDLIQEAAAQALVLSQQNAADKELLVRLAGLQHRAKDDAAAQATLERFLTLGNTEAEHLRVARLLENWEEPPAAADSRAAQAYARLAESFPASISAQEAQAHYLHRRGRRDEALAIWKRLAKSAALEDLLRIAQALQARQESRTALDLLIPREADFANEPRFYALLVQLGLACKEVERTLPWARTRLRLAQDAETIEAAVKDTLLVLRSDEAGKLSAPLLQELENEKTPSIQNRCLLAALLENDRKGAEAEKVLDAAPAADKVVALSQLAQLYQTRQAWEKAAQTLQQVIALPGQRSTARVQRLVDWYRRAEKFEQALTWIAEWKKLSPSAVQPWLDESRLLIDLDRTKEALALLRTALRKFPDHVEAASSYASRCLENGQADEAERTYLTLYEKTADATARLRLIGPLAQAAQQHGTLPRLIENFRQRQQQNRASAQPWLALAELHRATNNDEERRRCLYEASRLRPQDLALLLDIARSEEEIGLTAEALRTLESAAKLDKTSKTRENIARLQIESGDADLGYRMLFELAGGNQMDARALEQMADTIAEKGEWERVLTFLQPTLEKHPGDYRLHYLHAVALEEAGREKEAVRAFIEIMGMHEELPGVTSTGRSIGLRRQYDTLALPPGTEDWLVLPAMAQAAYGHRHKQGGRGSYGGYNPFGSASGNGLPANGFVSQAPGVTDSPVLALAHVLQIIVSWDVAEREPALRSLKQAGVADAALLLAAAENSPQLVITPEMLDAQPQNAALHAAWLMQSRGGDPSEMLHVCERAFQLFKTSHPALALRTAALAWRSGGDQSSAWVPRILEICESLRQGGPAEQQMLIGLLRTHSELFPQQTLDPNVSPLSAKEVRAITAILKRWMRTADTQQNYHIAEVIFALAGVKDWESMVEIIQHRLSLPDTPQVQGQTVPGVPPPPQPPPRRGGRSYFSEFQPSPMPMTSIAFKLPPDVLSWVERVSPQQIQDEDLDDAQRQWKKDFHDGLKPFIEKASEPGLKLILRLMTGEQQSMLDELAPRLAASPALDDLLLAGWLCQQMNQSEKALGFFQQAQVLATEAQTISELDLAMVYHAQRLLQEADKAQSEKLAATVKPVLEHLSQTAVTQEQKFMVVEMFNAFDMQEEAQQIMKAAQSGGSVPRSQNTAAISNPYSRSYTYRQQQKKRVSAEELLQKGDRAAAVQEVVSQLRVAVQGCLNPQNSSSSHYQLHELINLCTQHKLTDDVMQAMQKAAAAGWKPQQEYAVLLEHTGMETKPAIEAHRAVIAANPRAFASHARLAVLLSLEGDFQTALQHWALMPEITQTLYLPSVTQELTERSPISVPRPAALSGLLSAWLRSLPPARTMPAGMSQHFYQVLNSLQNGVSDQTLSFPSLWEPYREKNPANGRRAWALNDDGTLKLTPQSQKARDERRAAQNELCQAMMQIPELALMGFAPLAGMAMFENTSLAEMEKTALDLLSQRAMPKVRRRLAAQGGGSSYYGGTYPASAFGSFFATHERIPMPVPAVFATYSAALRGDQRLLDEVVFPAILKAEGKAMTEYCRAYAALLTADEAHFVSAAEAWLKPAGTRGRLTYSSHQAGSPLEEIVRLWDVRQIKEPLNHLFISQTARDTSIRFGYVAEVLKTYAFALGQRDPEAMRGFIRSLRDQWIGATPELRAEKITAWREAQHQRQRGGGYFPSRVSRSGQAVAGYVQGLQNLLQDRRGLPLLPLATEDGLLTSPDWLRQVASRFSSSNCPSVDDFMQTAGAIGFLGEAASFRAYLLGESHTTWLGNLARDYREHWNDDMLATALTRIGQGRPTFGSHLLQALLVKRDGTLLQIDGKPTPVTSSLDPRAQLNRDGGAAPRSAALRLVLVHHAKDIAAMPATSQSELSSLLQRELDGYPHPDQMGEELTQVLAPLLQIENQELHGKADQVLAAAKWTDLGREEYQFIEQFPMFLRDLAIIDAAKAEEVARHAVELLRGSAVQKRATMRRNSDSPVYRFLSSLGQSPQMVRLAITLAEQEGFTRSREWTGSLLSHLQNSLSSQGNVPALFSRTPWVADAAEFRDLKYQNDQEPTLLARIINVIDNQRALQVAARDFLAKQPATFGTELVLAFLHRAPGDDPNVRSFYSPKRPDDSALLAFIQKRQGDFAKLQPESAACLLALLRARMPDLEEKSAADPALKQALDPLAAAEGSQSETELARWMQITNFANAGVAPYQAMQEVSPLLDRLAQSDKPRAIALLDHFSKLLAREDAQSNRGRNLPLSQTHVAQWLAKAATVPELLREVLQRAGELGATKDSAWMENVLNSIRYISQHREHPRRFIALLEATGMLDPAATFNPMPLQGAARIPNESRNFPGRASSVPETMLEVWRDELVQGRTFPHLAEELQKRQPRTLGVGIVLLMCGSKSSADITAFASAHADEIALASAEQKKMLAGFFERQHWADIMAPLVPALHAEFAPLLQKQETLHLEFFESLMKTTRWEQIEDLYYQNVPQTPGPGGGFNGMPMARRNRGYYSPMERNPAMEHLASQLAFIARSAPDRAQKGLEHVFNIHAGEFSSDGDPFRKPLLTPLYQALGALPRLTPAVLQCFSKAGPPVFRFGRDWNELNLIEAALPDATLAGAAPLIAAMDEMGLLAEASAFDPVPVLGPSQGNAMSLFSWLRMNDSTELPKRSLLGLVLWRLQKASPEVREQTALMLAEKSGAHFGHHLMSALLTAGDDAGKAARMQRCSAEFAGVSPAAAGAILLAFADDHPALLQPENTDASLRPFAPLLRLRDTEERACLKAVMEGRAEVTPPFRGYIPVVAQELERLMEAGKNEEALALVRAMRRRLEPQDAAALFGKSGHVRDGERLSEFLRDVTLQSDKPAALIACQLQAAARMPEIRLKPDHAAAPKYGGNSFPLFLAWGNHGGWAAPAETFGALVKDISRHADPAATRGLWLPLMHEMLARMGAAEQRELSKWAADQNGGSMKIPAAELTLALSLMEATEPVHADPASTRLPAMPASPQREKKFASASAACTALLKDGSIPSHVRLALAGFLTAIYPGLLDDETVQTWALEAAQAWHEGGSVSQFELNSLLTAGSVLPDSDSWKQTSRLVLERWRQREEIMRASGTRYIESAFPPFLMRYAARSASVDVIQQLLKDSYGTAMHQMTGILLESGDARHAMDARLSQSLQNLSSKTHATGGGWLPASAETLKALQSHPADDALLSEAVALRADDLATQVLYPRQPRPDRKRRFEDFAKKLSSLPPAAAAEKRILPFIALGLEDTAAALPLLAQYDELAKMFTSADLSRDQNHLRLWSDFFAIHAALKLARGEAAAADTWLKRVKNDPASAQRSDFTTLETDFRHTLFFCLAQLWQAGEARDPEKLSRLSLLGADASNKTDSSHYSVPQLNLLLQAWQAALKGGPLPAERDSSIRDNDMLLDLATAAAGSGKTRLSFQQRLNLFMQLSARAGMAAGTRDPWDELVHRDFFTSEELLKEGAVILKEGRLLPSYQLSNLAAFMLRHGALETAEAAWALAGSGPPSTSPSAFITHFTNRLLLDRAAVLIRLKKPEQARACLAGLDAKDLTASNRQLHAALLRLLAPPAPAPAK